MKTIAIIGCGKRGTAKEGWAIGHAHANGYLNCGHDIKLLGVDLSPENLQAFGEAFELPEEQLFSSTDALYEACTPDVVSICTWPALHHPMVMEAIEKGVKGIACEKPLALDTQQIREIENKAAETGTKIVVAHQRRCDNYAAAFKQIVDEKLLGDNLQAIGEVGDGWDILSWTTHWFDMANYLFDGPPASILAGMDIRDSRRYQHAVEDSSLIRADYGERGSALFITGPGTGASFRLRGDEGMARIDKASNWPPSPAAAPSPSRKQNGEDSQPSLANFSTGWTADLRPTAHLAAPRWPPKWPTPPTNPPAPAKPSPFPWNPPGSHPSKWRSIRSAPVCREKKFCSMPTTISAPADARASPMPLGK
jgi:predicted dehydrogenase